MTSYALADDHDRPQARLVREGPAALSTRELLALVTWKAALPDELPPLRQLAGATPDELETLADLGPAGAARLAAALELGARAVAAGRDPAAAFTTPAATAAHLLPRYSTRPVETFGVLALDVRHRLRREAVISVGCLTSSLVHPREVFHLAVTARAAALILFHNHPSGDAEPSGEDVALTRRLASAGTLMGVEVLDHLILGAGTFVSLKDRGLL